ncbi:alpha/beta fold hydrolase [uncultured Sphingomonas sp.]|uniref:alpha/beta fold hydrolase n=1 Tax=uncultured Sphingomonas sp. TaxID=158754 RepID=UPI0035CB9ED9
MAAAIGAALSFGVLVLFAPIAPYFWLLIFLPLLVGGLAAAGFARFFARRAGLSRLTGSSLAAIVALLPLGGIVTAMLVSPFQPRAEPGPDPRGPHRLLRSGTGASIAWWALEPERPRHRTPVVFLHGGPGDLVRPRDFDVGSGFRDAGFRTVFYDQAGGGASGDRPIGEYTLANAVADLDSLRAALGTDKIVLWGQSWGASLATAYVRAHPDRVAATILESPGDFPGEPLPLDYSGTDTKGGFKPTLRDATIYLLIGHAPQLAERWQSQPYTRATHQARSATTTHIYGYQCKDVRKPLPRPLSPGGHNLYPQLRLQSDLETQPRIGGTLSSAPTLLVRGGCDFIPPATAARFVRAFPATTRIDVPGRGHGFFGHDAELRRILNRYALTTLARLP